MTMVNKRHVPAGEFKAKCLALLDDVASTGRPLVVTKRGRPVAEVVPIEPPESLAGSVEILVSEDELIAPIDERWDAES
jgi:prevent-host-death family protein